MLPGPTQRLALFVGCCVAALGGACTVQVVHGPGRKCDVEKPCSEGRLCVEGLCADASAAQPPCGLPATEGAENLVTNPSFEADTLGWEGRLGASISRSSPGLIGDFALKVQATIAGSEFGIENEDPRWVAATPGPGARFCFTAWVRSERSPRLARVRVREYYESTQQGSSHHSLELPLSPSWQRLDTLVETVGPSGGSLDFQVTVVEDSLPGDAFEVDAVGIRSLP